MGELGAYIAAIAGLTGVLGAVCATVLPVVVLAGLVFFLYRQHQRSQAVRAAARSWQQTTGTVVSSTVQVRRTGRSRSEIPVVVYQYVVHGQTYHGQTVRAGERFFSARLAGQARETAARYPSGASVTVYYDPQNPAESALET
jgi:hypothetical protein